MVLNSEEYRLAFARVVLAASCLTSFYFARQNRLLRRLIDSNTCNDHSLVLTKDDNESDSICSENKTMDERKFVMEEIGVIQSPFPQRAGCPRQGTLAPHIKSLLVLHPHISPQVLDGIQAYSHLWIIFQFHLNPRNKARSNNNTTSQNKFTASKVRPPRASGLKVGVLATRAPHRPNPVGLSLALLENVTVTHAGNGRKQACLELRGLDLVDGTPVYDIKPFVPWDQINCDSHKGNALGHDLMNKMIQLRVPPWVSADDELTQVQWLPSARNKLYQARKHLHPWYDATDNGADEASKAIQEIVAQDPRAVRDGRGRPSNSDSSFEFTFGNLRIHFVADTDKSEASIVDVIVDKGDLTASEGSYPHNLALRRLAEEEAQRNGTKLDWASPVREGITDGLFDLKDGSTYDYKLRQSTGY